MDQNAIAQMQRQLLATLKEEYSFYQTLYLTLDKQRDAVKFNTDGRLLDLFTEVERCHKRIQASEDKIGTWRQNYPDAFQVASANEEVRKLVNSIATLVKKNMTLVAECEQLLQGRYQRIKQELGELKNSQQILQYLNGGDPAPQFVDGKS